MEPGEILPSPKHEESTNNAQQTSVQPNTKTSRMTPEDRTLLSSIFNILDTSFDRKDPYILTVPQEPHAARYEHKRSFGANQWRRYAPFHSEEHEGLQYQTYRFVDPGDPIYKQHVIDWPTKTTPTPRTPNAPGKKGMSIAEYKRMKASPLAGSQEQEKTASKNPVDRLKAEDADLHVKDQTQKEQVENEYANNDTVRENGVAGSSPLRMELEQEKRKDATTKVDPNKRKRDDGHVEVDDLEPTSASKRLRKDEEILHQPSTTTPDSHSMPPRLSPLRDILPARLSPDLPVNIINSISHRQQAKKEHKIGNTDKQRSQAPKNGFRAGSDSPNGVLLSRNDSPHASKKIVNKQNGTKKGVSKAEQSAVGEISNTTPTSRKRHLDKDVVTKSHTISEPVKKKVKALDSASDVQRKTSPLRPETPTSTNSPEMLRTPTVRKDGTAMQRLRSNEGQTPDIAAAQANGHSKALSTNKSTMQKAWLAESNKWSVLGRAIKHESQEHAKANPKEADLAAVKALEMFACYMLVGATSDEAAIAAEVRQPLNVRFWLSLRPLLTFTQQHQIEPLKGPLALLAMVYASHMLEVIQQSGKLDDKEMVSKYLQLLWQSGKEMDSALNIEALQKSFPGTWKNSVKGSLKPAKLDREDLLAGEYQLLIGVHTTVVQAVRCVRAMLTEWLDTSKLTYKLQI